MSMPPEPTQAAPAFPPQPQRPPVGPAIAWLLGLIVLVCLPFIGSFLAGVLMVAVGLSQRGKSEPAARNGARAANWGLTYLLASIVLVGIHFYLVIAVATDDEPMTQHFFPVGIPITLWGLLSLAHVVMCVWGGAVALQGKPFRGNGIPFFGHADARA